MSIDIRSGGLVAVDTTALRDAARRYAAERRELAEVRGMLHEEAARLGPVLAGDGGGGRERVASAARHADTAADEAGDLARRLREMAAVYEIVELRATRAVADASGDEGAIAALDARLRALAHDEPGAARLADDAESAWRRRVAASTTSVAANAMSPVDRAVFLSSLTSVFALLGAGRPAPSVPLRGAPVPVEIRQVGRVRSGKPPATVAAAVGRIPQGDDARVRVERYTMGDGTRRFAVYVAGTRSTSVGGTDPWDMESNVQLYTGSRSASYDATVAALRDAGARPGDPLYVFGHSQGGMIADRLVLEGGYDSRLLVTAGAPTEADAGPGTLSVQLRHTDDPVAALVVGGAEAPVGAAGSVVVEGHGEASAGGQSLTLAAHHLNAYVDTARELDASSDPRAGGVHEVLGDLRSAASVEVREYDAERGER